MSTKSVSLRSEAQFLFEHVPPFMPAGLLFQHILLAPTIGSAVEVGLPALVALARDRRLDVPPPQAAPRGRAAVPFVPSGAPRPQPRMPPAGAADGPHPAALQARSAHAACRRSAPP